jgi:hypothetical protein
MSGGGKAGGGNALMTLGAIAAVAATGGAALGVIGPTLAAGAVTSGVVGAAVGNNLVKKATGGALNKLNNSLLKPISKLQVMPTVDNEAVQQQRANSLTQLQQRSGRASTLLTNQFGG